MAHVRNTIRNIDQALLLEARVLALQSDQSLGEVITAALEFYLADQLGWEEPTVAEDAEG